jgi:integrase
MSKPDPIAVNGAFCLLPPYDRYTSYRIEWYDKTKRRIVGLSTGTTDLQTAQKAFYQHCLNNTPGAATEEVVKDEPAAQAMSRYYLKHAANLPSAGTALAAMNSANESFKDKLVSQVDADAQLIWVTSMRAQGIADNTITRWLGVVFAAFNYAVTFKHISQKSVPARLNKRHWGVRTVRRKRISGDASRRELTPQELGRLCDTAATSRNAFRYFVSALGSGGRPIALVNLTTAQFNAAHRVLDLKPVGREQNDKYHPRIAVAPIFAQHLAEWGAVTDAGHYMGHRGAIIESKNFFKKYIHRSGVTDCCPYTLRHTVASWLAGHGVPKWERNQFMGHQRPDGNTSDDYSHCDPKYMAHCAAAIQLLFEAVAQHTRVDLMKHQWEDQPSLDVVEDGWLGDFFGRDGHRLVRPGTAPSRLPESGVAYSRDLDIPAMAQSTGDRDLPNRAYSGPNSADAPYVRRTLPEVSPENPLKSMGRLGLEPRTNTLKGSEEGKNINQDQ